MGIIDVLINVNSHLKSAINHMADKAIAEQAITGNDLNILIKRLGRVAYFLKRKKNYEALVSFCGGIASAFERIDAISNNFEREAKSFISNIKIITSFLIDHKHTEADAREEYGGLDDIKSNLLDSLNGLAAAIKREEIPKAPVAAAAA